MTPVNMAAAVSNANIPRNENDQPPRAGGRAAFWRAVPTATRAAPPSHGTMPQKAPSKTAQFSIYNEVKMKLATPTAFRSREIQGAAPEFERFTKGITRVKTVVIAIGKKTIVISSPEKTHEESTKPKTQATFHPWKWFASAIMPRLWPLRTFKGIEARKMISPAFRAVIQRPGLATPKVGGAGCCFMRSSSVTIGGGAAGILRVNGLIKGQIKGAGVESTAPASRPDSPVARGAILKSGPENRAGSADMKQPHRIVPVRPAWPRNALEVAGNSAMIPPAESARGGRPGKKTANAYDPGRRQVSGQAASEFLAVMTTQPVRGARWHAVPNSAG